ncbi:hypothetical protein BDF14DRAFT_1216323 [Spinellus fusiger]|nr:hypothetical protein BDF14DRAFT_1216323 [Spinellus fusiger]
MTSHVPSSELSQVGSWGKIPWEENPPTTQPPKKMPLLVEKSQNTPVETVAQRHTSAVKQPLSGIPQSMDNSQKESQQALALEEEMLLSQLLETTTLSDHQDNNNSNGPTLIEQPVTEAILSFTIAKSEERKDSQEINTTSCQCSTVESNGPDTIQTSSIQATPEPPQSEELQNEMPQIEKLHIKRLQNEKPQIEKPQIERPVRRITTSNAAKRMIFGALGLKAPSFKNEEKRNPPQFKNT